MTDDFETKLKTLLAEQVDSEVGPRRTAPPFDPERAKSRGSRRARAPWLMPLAAAACVAAVVIAAVSAVHLLGHHDSAPATGPTPSVSSKPGTAHLAVPTTIPRSPAVIRPSGTPTTVIVSGASLVLPHGWAATAVTTGSEAPATWCLHPAGEPLDRCSLTLYEDFGGHTRNLDVDHPGLGLGDPPQLTCDSGPSRVTEQAAHLSLGKDQVEYRLFDHYCAQNRSHRYIAQYVDPYGASWALLGVPADPALLGVMDLVATSSHFPARTPAGRSMDRGYLRSVTAAGGQVKIEIQRTLILNGKRYIDGSAQSRQRYDYTVPETLFDAAHLGVGTPVVLHTDGAQVTAIARDT